MLLLVQVLVLDIPHETIVERISNRMIHPASGRVYNQTYNPEKNEGFDDDTGEPLVQRDDDKPATVKARLVAYEDMTSPLIAHYEALAESAKGLAQMQVGKFAGTESDVIFPEIVSWLEGKKLV